MKFALVKNGEAIEGDLLADILTLTNLFKFDLNKGYLYFRGKQDTISYSSTYTPKEMISEMAQRGMKLLESQGWKLYKTA